MTAYRLRIMKFFVKSVNGRIEKNAPVYIWIFLLKKLMYKDNNDIEKRIFQVAGKRFAKYGFHNTTLRDITKAANCNGAAVNYHFRSKKNLYISVCKYYIKILVDEWRLKI